MLFRSTFPVRYDFSKQEILSFVKNHNMLSAKHDGMLQELQDMEKQICEKFQGNDRQKLLHAVKETGSRLNTVFLNFHMNDLCSSSPCCDGCYKVSRNLQACQICGFKAYCSSACYNFRKEIHSFKCLPKHDLKRYQLFLEQLSQMTFSESGRSLIQATATRIDIMLPLPKVSEDDEMH